MAPTKISAPTKGIEKRVRKTAPRVANGSPETARDQVRTTRTRRVPTPIDQKVSHTPMNHTSGPTSNRARHARSANPATLATAPAANQSRFVTK